MNFASLATRYRPQTFAEVTGQDTIKKILSRAAAESRVAPAYLLSGTRGVGKTTIARIFAKALNCVHAPTEEPCNECSICRSITQGSFVDVIEIDGASNRRIDDVRNIIETVGYAPMEGRYKVFIIDEAHMLTKEAFNALLKTLEEPPSHVTFILATTEPHKFPVTIISRCQHFIFKAISESELEVHLSRVLKKENIDFEENAIRLIARRAAGSVRDSMSILGQTLALGGDTLTEQTTRQILGLASQELYEQLLLAISQGDCVSVSKLTSELLSSGIDINFFLNELTTLWRNIFLLNQAGDAALPLIDLPEAERNRLVSIAQQFSLTSVHAAWQMTIEGKNRLINNLDPGAALELLLLNLALTPRLASLELLSQANSKLARNTSGKTSQNVCTAPNAVTAQTDIVRPTQLQKAHPDKIGSDTEEKKKALDDSSKQSRCEANPYKINPASVQTESSSPKADSGQTKTLQPCSWEGFQRFCFENIVPGKPVPPAVFQQLRGECTGNEIRIIPTSQTLSDQIAEKPRWEYLKKLARQYAGRDIDLVLAQPVKIIYSMEDIKRELESHPAFHLLEKHFGAVFDHCIDPAVLAREEAREARLQKRLDRIYDRS